MKLAFPKIFFFDLEGTLLKKDFSLDNGKVAPSAWTVLAKALGNDCYIEEEATKDKWNAGHYKGYLDWMSDTVRIQKKYGLSKDVFDRVISSAELHSGVVEVFREIRNRKSFICVISGGFKALIDQYHPLLKPDHVFCACEYFFDSEGKLASFNLLPTDEAGKVAFMRLVLKEHGISPRDSAFVGDGKNDVYLARETGVSIAFNAQPELRAVCDYTIDQPFGQEDFSEVLKYFD
ncbi:HAD family hydrolase [Marinobacter nauticus]|uniref:HAD family hydrolase n=1 Tax=Marinobacter nauticus TaxID=2743 RepID=UPI001C958246|nr:HAD-IB family phosphatase [Marinobacter nauticus]MBY6220013.1 HAD-IB family phosphatase [Marinobacter nauticus]